MPNRNHTHAIPHTRHTAARRLLSSRSAVAIIILTLLAATCGVTATVLACGWSGTTRSVRFNWTTTEREMSRLPRLSADEDNLERDGDNTAGVVYDYEAAAAEGERNVAELFDVWQRALLAGERGELAESRLLLRRYLELTAPDVITDWSDRTDADAQIPPDPNSARDRLDALTALDHGAPHAAVQAYLAARNAYDAKFNTSTPATVGATSTSGFSFSKPADSAQSSNASPSPTPQDFSAWEEFLRGKDAPRQFDAATADPRLRDNCDYLRAAILYRANDYPNAAQTFQKLADSSPASEKRDAARYMAGLAWMRASSSYNNGSANDTEACPTCQDEAWTRARAAFTRVTREHPRFAADARGWLGYLNLRVGRTAEGLAEYYRLLAVEKNKEARFNAITSLSMTRSLAAPADAEQLERLLAPEPDIALTYLYHNLYNYTFSYDLAVAEETSSYYLESSYSDSPWKTYERNRRADARRETSQGAELRRMAGYASELMRRYPRANLAGNFAVRLAEINLELDEHTSALKFADRALGGNVKGDFRAEAIWVKGVAEHRLDKLEAARRTLQKLVNEFPRHRLTEGARRHLAMTAEDAGDLGAALEQYLALDYMEDIAYFVDVLMTPEQLRAFIESHPRHKRISELWYALGVRQLRSGRWAEAREAYARVKTAEGTSGWEEPSPECYSNGNDHPCEGKETFYGEARRGVKHEWILRDLQTIDALESFERRAAEARDDEQRAEALYQMASYLFEGSELVFYNPAAWQPSRYHNLTYLFTSGGFRAPGEVPRFWQHMREHSENARALEIYLRIARDYPQTRAARDALYTAAVATEKLEAVGEWSELYATEFYKQGHGVTYTDVRRTYPSYQLPRGTLDWEPSTRTVGGGPGWSPKPKPAPHLSKFERGQRKAWAIYEGVTTPVAEVWSDTLRPPLVAFNSWVMMALHWLLAACAFACLLTMWRAAAWSRRVWRERVRRREQSGGGSALAVRVAHGRKAHAKFLRRSRRALDWDYREVRDGLRLRAIASYRFALRRGRRALPTLAASSRRSLADPHERQLLALNALTHGAFVVLLITLLRLI